MAALAALAPYIGTAVSAAAALKQGNDAKVAADFKASQYEQNAGQAKAIAQREAADTRRQTGYVTSRALAAAAASGAGASDPTVERIISNVEGEGEYRALTALYNGDEAARSMENAAIAERVAGRNAKTAGYLGAATSALSNPKVVDSAISGGQSLYNKYRPTPTYSGDPTQAFSRIYG